MQTRRTFLLAMRVIAALAFLAFALPLHARDPKVSGTLSSPTASVGEPVQYELMIEGDSTPTNPPVPTVDGLELRGTSQGSQLSIVNGDVSRRATITYTLVPKREGTFTIPAMEVEVGGRKLSTRAVTLTVTPGEPVDAAGDFAFADIRIAKRAVYVGEAVPMEVRLFLEGTARWNLQKAPVISGDGFTTQPFGQPEQREAELAGKRYMQVIFRTVITPGKAGKVKIGPLPASLVFSKPQQRRNQYDLFGFQKMGPAQEIEVTAPAVELDVKPLPVEGRPEFFSGAVGKFEFEGVGTPGQVNVGEPIQMTLAITGTGNFDRIGAPSIEEADGWRTYDSEEDFAQSDDLGINGRKTWRVPVAPTEPKTAMPQFAFAFFDPEKAQYQVLKSTPQPLTVIGAALPTAKPAESVSVTAPAPEAPKPTPVADILGNLPQVGPVMTIGVGLSPAVLFGTMLAPLPVLLGLLVWRSRRQDGSAARLAAMRKERADLLSRLHRTNDRSEAHDLAARVLQLDVAMQKGCPPAGVELREVLDARSLGAETVDAIRELFAARAELLFAGGGGDGAVSSKERDRLVEAIAAYERSSVR